MKRTALHQIITILVTLQMVAINALANILPINGQQTGEISDRFNVYFVPAGYVFAIWGVIYLGLAAYTIYQALPSQADDPTLRKISLYYWVSSVANSVWVLLWHYERFPITLLAMVVILLALIATYTTLKDDAAFSAGARLWFVVVPFSIYLGWITVATVANISQVLVFLGWGGWGLAPALWAAIMVVVAALVGIMMAIRFGSVAYNLVLIWAFIGIAYKQADNSLLFTTTLLGVGLAAVAVLLGYFRSRRA